MPRTTKNKKRPATKRLGERITEGLTEALEALRSGEPLEKRFRVDTIEIPDPPRFTPAAVRMLRAQLRVTQSMLAKILGVSVELVEHWEQGIRTPRPMACRLLNELRGSGWIHQATAGEGSGGVRDAMMQKNRIHTVTLPCRKIELNFQFVENRLRGFGEADPLVTAFDASGILE